MQVRSGFTRLSALCIKHQAANAPNAPEPQRRGSRREVSCGVHAETPHWLVGDAGWLEGTLTCVGGELYLVQRKDNKANARAEADPRVRHPICMQGQSSFLPSFTDTKRSHVCCGSDQAGQVCCSHFAPQLHSTVISQSRRQATHT